MTDNATVADTFANSDISLPRPVRFWLFLILLIPSVYCSFVLLFYLFIDKNLRSQLSNHIIMVLLIIGLILEFTDIPFHLSFLHLGFVQPATPLLCILWWFLDYGFYNSCTIIMAWGSLHRYLLIFHDRLFLTRKKRFLFHYIPLISLTLYTLIFYIYAIVFPPCVNTYDYRLPICNGFPCYFSDPVLGIWDSICNNIVPTFLIAIFSIFLLIRVYFRKRRLQQRNLWRKQRKMAIQLLSNSAIYIIADIPFNLCVLAHLCGLPNNVGVEAQLYFNFLCYFIIIVFPFACLGILSELSKKIKWKGLFLFRRPHQTTRINRR